MGTFNAKVLQWASGQAGKQVGAGECWDLANKALRQAGAGTSSDFGGTGADDDYIWGDEVALKDALPGDILQYRDYEMTTTSITDVTFADGSGWTDKEEPHVTTVGHPHHTAILSRNPGDGAITVLEQNYMGNKDKVRSSAIRWKGSPAKKTTTRKMMKRADDGKMAMATVEVTVGVTVTGTLKAYTPKAP
ncbi:hypothetical protein [Variovorax boronicumulans]|uniref:hypothetical protein n=1 Tax=Variovorax boronicumulans TaxID=436515 RepID=UPI00339664C1